MTTTIGRSASWGTRSQIGGTIKELADLRGNRDGIWDNESAPARQTGGFFAKNPLALKLSAAASTGVSVADEVKVLADFVAERERAWGAPVMDAAVKAQLNGGDLFAAQKAILLARYDRTPQDVVERFVDAAGTVDGVRVEASRVFTQHFLPIGEPTGDVVVMSPGFLETGRAFAEQVDRLNKAGAYVVVMDHQWAGQTQGKKGGIESGESIALHTAAVVADAARVGRARYGADLRVTVVGESMGGGPGAFGAALLSRAGKLSIDGADDPLDDPLAHGVDLFLQAPFFGATPNALNAVLKAAASAPFLNKLAMPGAGLPDFVDDGVGEHKVAQGMVAEDIRGRTQAFKASDAFVAKLDAMVEAGARTGGKVIVVHDDQDPLADPARSRRLVGQLGKDATLIALQGGDHGLSASDPQVIEHLVAHLRAR